VDVLDAFNKIVTLGNSDIAVSNPVTCMIMSLFQLRSFQTPPTGRHATRFLSRFDKSATNIKESQLFITIGQVPWALAYSKWYHQYPRFPLEALQAAAALNEYTLTDRGIWLSSPTHVTDTLRIYQRGDRNDPDHWLLNPGRALLGAQAAEKDLASMFLDWLIDDNGGPKVVATFEKNGQVLFSPVQKDERLS
jgi:ABC-type tungstate transport system permease subunit